jgi:hypothetical protein
MSAEKIYFAGAQKCETCGDLARCERVYFEGVEAGVVLNELMCQQCINNVDTEDDPLFSTYDAAVRHVMRKADKEPERDLSYMDPGYWGIRSEADDYPDTDVDEPARELRRRYGYD